MTEPDNGMRPREVFWRTPYAFAFRADYGTAFTLYLTVSAHSCCRMVGKLDLHESAIVPYRSPVLAIVGFEDAQSSRPIPVCADRRFRDGEPTPTACH